MTSPEKLLIVDDEPAPSPPRARWFRATFHYEHGERPFETHYSNVKADTIWDALAIARRRFATGHLPGTEITEYTVKEMFRRG